MAPGRSRRRARRGPRAQRRRGREQRRAHPVRWCARRTGEPVPHQGGPVGEGSIENGWLRCPWHGYDYDPQRVDLPEGFTDGRSPPSPSTTGTTVSTCSFRSDRPRSAGPRRHGRDPRRPRDHARLRHGRALQPRVRRRDAQGRGARRPHLHRYPARGRGRLRCERLWQANRSPRRLLRDRRTRFDDLLTGLYDAKLRRRTPWWRSRARSRPACWEEAPSRTWT